MKMRAYVAPFVALVLTAACALAGSDSGPSSRSPASGGSGGGSTTAAAARTTGRVDPAHLERLKRVMVPLIQVAGMRPVKEIKVGLVDDDRINAGSAGDGQYIVTTGLLRKANDQQLAGVLAHEVAHDDLGHVAKQQRLQTGLAIGMVLLDQIVPGSGQITPVAGTLIARAYSRREEYEADAYGAEILKRAGHSPKVMEQTLTWLMSAEGGSKGGFFSTHPATDDRIAELRRTVP
jgi:predicted Zn-dependent protease